MQCHMSISLYSIVYYIYCDFGRAHVNRRLGTNNNRQFPGIKIPFLRNELTPHYLYRSYIPTCRSSFKYAISHFANGIDKQSAHKSHVNFGSGFFFSVCDAARRQNHRFLHRLRCRRLSTICIWRCNCKPLICNSHKLGNAYSAHPSKPMD